MPSIEHRRIFLAHVVHSGIDAAGKLRPSPEELATIGPEFRERWETYFKDVPDKPVIWFGAVSEYVSFALSVPARSRAVYTTGL